MMSFFSFTEDHIECHMSYHESFLFIIPIWNLPYNFKTPNEIGISNLNEDSDYKMFTISGKRVLTVLNEHQIFFNLVLLIQIYLSCSVFLDIKNFYLSPLSVFF